jgi:hypothetical protein
MLAWFELAILDYASDLFFLLVATKRPWSEAEKKAVQKHFHQFIVRSSQEIGRVHLPGLPVFEYHFTVRFIWMVCAIHELLCSLNVYHLKLVDRNTV